MAQALKRGSVVVLGASGQIGRFVLPRLLCKGYGVLAVSRAGRPDDYPELALLDWIGLEKLRQVGAEASLLVSAGPLGLALQAIEDLPSLERVVAFSTTSVQSKADSPDPLERDIVRTIATAEARLGAECAARGIGLVLLRPTLVYGCGLDVNVTRLAKLMRWLPWFPVAGAAGGKRQPVHADDLAVAAVDALGFEGKLPETLFLCGGSTLSYLEMLKSVASASGRRLRPLRLPVGLMTLGFRALSLLPGFRDINPAMVERQNQDLVFDDAPARELLAYRPRAFRPQAEDLARPDRARILALAGAAGKDGNRSKSAKMQDCAAGVAGRLTDD